MVDPQPDSARGRLAGALREIRNAHGRRPYRQIVERAARQSRVKLNDSSVSDWLRGESVPNLPGVFVAFVKAITGEEPDAPLMQLYRQAQQESSRSRGLAGEAHKYTEHRARPGLTVVFDPSDPACVQDRRDHPQRDFQLRLRATNTGTVALTEVRCRLKARHDTYGRIRHDNTPPYDRSHNGITLQPGKSDYFDIAFCHFDQPQMVLEYADKYLRDEQIINPTPKTTNTPVEVTFEARREDTNEWIPTKTKRYVVAPAGDAITLTEADAGGEGRRSRI